MNKSKEVNTKRFKDYKSIQITTEQQHLIDDSQTRNFADQDNELVRIDLKFNSICSNKL